MQNRVQKKKKISLTTMIFIALLAGALAGVIINYLIPSNYVVDDIIVQGVFYIVGQGFIRLMRMLVVPLVFCSIVCGSMAVGDTKKLGSVGVKTLIFYLCTTALAITVALSIANIFNPGKGLDMSQIQVTSTVSETTQSMYEITKEFLQITGSRQQVQEGSLVHNLWMDCSKAAQYGIVFSDVMGGLRRCLADYGLLQ